MGTYEEPTARRAATSWTDRVGGLARACHPGPVVAVTALTAALAVTAGQGVARCALTTAAVVTGQLSIGWCNDAFDARRDIAAGRRGKPVVDGTVGVTQVWVAAYAALALCVPLSFGCGLRAGVAHLAGVAAAWAYDLRLKATMWSWVPYAVGFAALPAFVALGLPGQPWPAWWLVTAGALLGVGAHLGDVLPDIRGDLATGVRGWPQRLGPDGARLLLPVPLVAASAVLALGPAGPSGRWGVAALAVAGLVAVAGTALGRRRERAAFAAAVAVAVVDVALLLLRGTGIA
ncbi:UbiA family prenyltransferase [Streptomyces sp. NBC_01571]|uniref:UbiA family prenyltransferase n=1 Tax=Streptomyces sp. NBC_01571 TaxID=2975883 RepID=UPI00224F6BF0|nr:UbiA family prenyltransferase [Streptomyces sp. NBC_01571]MCX4571996.1 UbiA family prenyltransferase [Streptomyces sp. NBC_01571]